MSAVCLMNSAFRPETIEPKILHLCLEMQVECNEERILDEQLHCLRLTTVWQTRLLLFGDYTRLPFYEHLSYPWRSGCNCPGYLGTE